MDAINAERTQMVNVKADDVTTLNEYLVIIRLAIKSLCGLDSSEYEMVGGTRASERKKPAGQTHDLFLTNQTVASMAFLVP